MTCFLRSADRSHVVPNPGCREAVEQHKSNAVAAAVAVLVYGVVLSY